MRGGGLHVDDAELVGRVDVAAEGDLRGTVYRRGVLVHQAGAGAISWISMAHEPPPPQCHLGRAVILQREGVAVTAVTLRAARRQRRTDHARDGFQCRTRPAGTSNTARVRRAAQASGVCDGDRNVTGVSDALDVVDADETVVKLPHMLTAVVISRVTATATTSSSWPAALQSDAQVEVDIRSDAGRVGYRPEIARLGKYSPTWRADGNRLPPCR